MKTNEFMKIDRVVSDRILKEQGDCEWQEICQSCKGKGILQDKQCYNCGGKGVIEYEKSSNPKQ